ncbi:MAG: tRNA glutamyl-Q(34) synthetase GluQRS [gamma proteobacterium symbiont of Ctena orbiculata]|nr:MAG: tRNA glutamyl-Q(34) synthetase GluQRS [gamma proteobacterium symbiont of Ctena orbiculata]PVV21650.1 MAG: tRNA glutamyl-Q(34) synthetase GluQRS [gamma proteobacterium symbiont of Ctena orbiculata]
MPDLAENSGYRGRFAPSPTGELHFGSLVAALGSYLDARSQNGEWYVRMEDLDRTREVKGSAKSILLSLESLGFCWDGEVVYQNQRTEAYAEAVDWLIQAQHAYPCGCSRKMIEKQAKYGEEGAIYPGICRNGVPKGRTGRSVRVFTTDEKIAIEDSVQGSISQQINREIGDFVIRRADGFHAYQLAVVIDDAWQGITAVIRGADLLSSTPRQHYLQQLLRLPSPIYAHLPVAVDEQGRKLSKQFKDAPINPKQPIDALLHAYAFLNQQLPPQRPESLEGFWKWAMSHWSLSQIPAQLQIPATSRRNLNNLR